MTAPKETAARLLEIVDAIDGFEADCDAEGHTDTGDVWDLLHRIRRGLRGLAKPAKPPVGGGE